MADTISPESRSRNMSAIKSRDTKPEVYLRKLLYYKGFRYRKNYSGVFGHPDIYLPKYKVAIFVHGCYWHRHNGCRYAYMPKSRVDFWHNKFEDNVRRDKLVKESLESQGIRYLVVWECTVKKMQKSNDFEKIELDKIYEFITN
ncbi:MAG: very short patch repair endonuclease [Clostridia bacterium]|nr:very short patch repair endonuclease [Clostridia bacterium]